MEEGSWSVGGYSRDCDFSVLTAVVIQAIVFERGSAYVICILSGN